MGAITIPAEGVDVQHAAALEAATHVTSATYAISHSLLICFGLSVLFYSLWAFASRSYFRLKHVGWSIGWSFSSLPVSSTPTPNPFHHKADNAAGRPGRARIHLPLEFPTYIIPRLNLSIGQAILAACVLIVVLFASFVGSHVIKDSTRTGYVSITLVPCVIALGNKALGVGTFAQTGYAAINWMHRWLGRLLFFITTVHVIAYFIIFAQTKSMSVEMSKFDNIMATISYVGFVIIFFASLGVVRRKWWYIFKICHHFGILLFAVGLNYHSAILRPWIGFSLALLIASVVIRFCTSRLQIAYLTPLPNSKSTIISLPSVRSGWIPGQNVRIRVLTGGMGWGVLEGHPFTLASAPAGGEGGKLVVKAAGNWTTRLFEVAKKRAWGDVEGSGSSMRGYPVAVLLEGPYGGDNLLYSAYTSVLLVAGGSGVSFPLGVAQGIIADAAAGKSCTQHLHLVWSVRERAAVNDFLPSFEALLETAHKTAPHLNVKITLYFTSVSRALVIRPFSAMPSSAALIPSTTSAPSSPALNGKLAPPGLLTPNASTETLVFTPEDEKVSSPDTEKASKNGEITPDQKNGSPDSNPFTDAFHELTKPTIAIQPGRPDYKAHLKEVVALSRIQSFDQKFAKENDVASPEDGGVAVAACGPGGMVSSLRSLCVDVPAIEFHAEEFSL